MLYSLLFLSNYRFSIDIVCPAAIHVSCNITYLNYFSLLKEVRGVLYALDIPWSQRTEEAIKVYL
jgi:hypothetical protein